MTRDGQTQTKSAIFSGVGGIRLGKPPKNVGQEFCTNADAGVGHGKSGLIVILIQLHLNLAARWRKFDRIRQNIPYSLTQPNGITLDWSDVRAECQVNYDIFGPSAGGHYFQRRL